MLFKNFLPKEKEKVYWEDKTDNGGIKRSFQYGVSKDRVVVGFNLTTLWQKMKAKWKKNE
jgi:hypothetical protein